MKLKIAIASSLGVIFLGALGAIVSIAAETPQPHAPPSQWDGVYTPAQSKRGEAFYSQYCLMCHGADLMGGEMAPPLVGGAFQANWNEQSLGDLFDRVRISMPLNAPGTLSRQEVADVLSYMLSKGNYPTGQNELPTRTDVLNTIKFVVTKPQATKP